MPNAQITPVLLLQRRLIFAPCPRRLDPRAQKIVILTSWLPRRVLVVTLHRGNHKHMLGTPAPEPSSDIKTRPQATGTRTASSTDWLLVARSVPEGGCDRLGARGYDVPKPVIIAFCSVVWLGSLRYKRVVMRVMERVYWIAVVTDSMF